MDSRTSVHVIKTACHVVVAVFVRPAALCADHYLRCLILCARLQSLASKAEFVYFVEVHRIKVCPLQSTCAFFMMKRF
ncbi:hypothetical protein Pelo_6809 [Pelomyxa schiedti]|nr:hypothetical protein Pelo_6809 [Pelomyxa schiedti]